MKINSGHGGGGRETSLLIKEVFLPCFNNDLNDAASLIAHGKIAFTTDSFVVEPLFFKGGDIGRLAVCGTVNDLLTAGAVPKYLSASFIIQEGMEIETLKRVAESMKSTAREAGVKIVTGDTKVIEGDGGLFINTSGIGEIYGEGVDFSRAEPGDSIIVTGNLGEHHACIMSARMGVQNEIASDAAPLCGVIRRLLDEKIPLHGMRDVTRGGLATILCELSGQYGFGAELAETDLPVSKSVRGLCDILGLDPLYMGNEGVMLIVLPREYAARALKLIRNERYGENAAVAGEIRGDEVTLKTRIGARRILTPLWGEGLPRIC